MEVGGSRASISTDEPRQMEPDSGITTTLGNKNRIKSTMEQVLKLNEKFYHGAPHRYTVYMRRRYLAGASEVRREL